MDHQDQSHLFIVDQLQAMRRKEHLYQCPSDYLSLSHAKSNHHTPATASGSGSGSVTSQDRRAMCSWGYEIVDACDIDRRHVCVAISYFDRFMCTNSRQAKTALSSRRSFQLIFIACLLIALKCRAGMIIDADFVTDMVCQGLYGQKEIFDVEKEILKALQWRLNGPSAHDFILYFVEFLPVVAKEGNPRLANSMIELANLQVEAAMLDYSIALQSPSSIAMAAMISTVQMLSREELNPLDRVEFIRSITMITGLSPKDMTIQLIRERLNDLVPSQKSFRRRVSCDSFQPDEFDCSSVSSLTASQAMGNVPMVVQMDGDVSSSRIDFECPFESK